MNFRTINIIVMKLFESFITSKGIVDYILENNPSLKNDYEVVHSLRERIQDRDYIEFKETIEAATQLDLSPGLKRVLKSIKNSYDLLAIYSKYL